MLFRGSLLGLAIMQTPARVFAQAIAAMSMYLASNTRSGKIGRETVTVASGKSGKRIRAISR
jgi:hypothetical protein